VDGEPDAGAARARLAISRVICQPALVRIMMAV
jgi:hypothetical protein